MYNIEHKMRLINQIGWNRSERLVRQGTEADERQALRHVREDHHHEMVGTKPVA